MIYRCTTYGKVRCQVIFKLPFFFAISSVFSGAVIHMRSLQWQTTIIYAHTYNSPTHSCLRSHTDVTIGKKILQFLSCQLKLYKVQAAPPPMYFAMLKRRHRQCFTKCRRESSCSFAAASEDTLA